MKVPLFDGRREFEADRADLLHAAGEVLSSGRYILGEHVRRFEERVAAYVGGVHAVGVANGTDALMLALKAVGIGPRDRVLTTPFTFMGTASAIVNVGAEPAFADIEPDTLNLSPERAREVLEGRSPVHRRRDVDPASIKAIVPVHLFGLPVDLDRFIELGREFGLKVVQDAAQAFGTRYKGRRIGAHADVTTFSFFPTKNLGGFGDGGMVITPSEEIADRVKLLRAQGSTGKYIHAIVGTNSRLDELQAALLDVRLSRIDEALRARADIAEAYDAALEAEQHISLPRRLEFAERTFHQYVVRIGNNQRDRVRQELADGGIDTAVHYPRPLHLQHAFASSNYQSMDFPEAELASLEVASLPIFSTMEDLELKFIASALQDLLGQVNGFGVDLRSIKEP